MSDQRKKYTPADKAKIALDAIKGELTLAQISSKYGVHSSQINAWKKQLLAYLPDAFNDKSKQQALTHNLEVADLYEQIGQLTLERDWLKKNLSYLDLKVRCSMISSDHQLTIKRNATVNPACKKLVL